MTDMTLAVAQQYASLLNAVGEPKGHFYDVCRHDNNHFRLRTVNSEREQLHQILIAYPSLMEGYLQGMLKAFQIVAEQK